MIIPFLKLQIHYLNESNLLSITAEVLSAAHQAILTDNIMGFFTHTAVKTNQRITISNKSNHQIVQSKKASRYLKRKKHQTTRRRKYPCGQVQFLKCHSE